MEGNSMIQFLLYPIAIILIVYALFKIFWNGERKTERDNDDPPLGI